MNCIQFYWNTFFHCNKFNLLYSKIFLNIWKYFMANKYKILYIVSNVKIFFPYFLLALIISRWKTRKSKHKLRAYVLLELWKTICWKNVYTKSAHIYWFKQFLKPLMYKVGVICLRRNTYIKWPTCAFCLSLHIFHFCFSSILI